MTHLGTLRAGVAVCLDLLARIDLEVGEYSANDGIRHLVVDVETLLCPHGTEVHDLRRICNGKAGQAIAITQTEAQAAADVEFDVKVAVVTLHGAEEKFQAAIHTRTTQRAFFHITDFRRIQLHVNQQCIVALCDGSTGCHIILCLVIAVFHFQHITLCALFFDDVFHSLFPPQTTIILINSFFKNDLEGSTVTHDAALFGNQISLP